MKAFQIETGTLLPLYRSNIDTDAILPKEYLKRINKIGFGEFLFDDWRYLPDRSLNPDFVLNKPQFSGVKFLLAGTNFGCGSSREHAVWALDDYGFRAIIAPSFGDIFYGNCFKNGILPAQISLDDADKLYLLSQQTDVLTVTIDLQQEVIVSGEYKFSFVIDKFRKETLFHGLDDIAQTLKHADEIRAFETQHREKYPWLFRQEKKLC